MPPPSLKKLLATAKVLIPHTGPLTDDRTELCQRLKVDSSTSQTSEQLRILAGNRCLVLLVGMQRWLEKEYWPVEAKEGLVASDFMLGTADMRIIRALCLQAITLLLLPLSQQYRDDLLSHPQPGSGPLKTAVTSFLDILTTHHPPSPPVGPSTRTSLPHTVITISMTKHIGPVFLSAILLAYTPTCPPEVHAGLRKQMMGVFGEIPPSTTVPQMSAALAFYEKGKNLPQARSDSWICKWPVYMRNSITNMMAQQLQRPGGITALMAYLYGETAHLQGNTSADTVKMHIIATGAIAHPSTAPIQEWLPRSIHNLLDIISPLNERKSPLLYIHSACYCIHHAWSTHQGPTSAYLDGVILQPVIQAASNPLNDPSPTLRRLTAILQAITTQSPYAPDYLDSLIRPILGPLFTLMQGYQVSHPSFGYQIKEIINAWAAQADRKVVQEVMGGMLDSGAVRMEDVASTISLPDGADTEP